MNFKEWEYLEREITDYSYLENIYYYPPFERSSIIYQTGNGNWEGYDTTTSRMYWRENLIFKL